MATVSHLLHPEAAQFAASAFPQLVRNTGTNFPVSGLAHDAAAAEDAYWKLRALRYGTGNLTIAIDWYADTASTGGVIWRAAAAAITPDIDTQDVETKALATANTVTDTHLGTTGQRLHRATITVTNLDSLALDDDIWVRIGRDAAAAGDTMAGDAVLTLATLSYSDT